MRETLLQTSYTFLFYIAPLTTMQITDTLPLIQGLGVGFIIGKGNTALLIKDDFHLEIHFPVVKIR